LVKTAGAKSRQALLIAGVVIAIMTVAFGGVIGYIAMPALAGLLMIVGYRTVKPQQIVAVWKTGKTQAVVLGVTFSLTMLIPLQNAVLVGVGISVILYTIRQSGQITIKRRIQTEEGDLIEQDPPDVLPANEVVVLQPYGSLFFAAAPVFEDKLPEVSAASRNSVVILRLRGRTDMGSTFMDVVRRYATALSGAGSRLVIVTGDRQVLHQLEVTGVIAVVGGDSVYTSDERVGATVRRAGEDALTWIAANRSDGGGAAN
jgi:SulP family sulfate permease